MKYIITGGTGYLGSEIVNYLLKKNHEVLNLDILKLDIKNSNYDYKKIDISNKFQLENSITSADVLIHNVAKVPLIKNKSEFENTNILGTRNVLDIALKKKIKTNFSITLKNCFLVFLSTSNLKNYSILMKKKAYLIVLRYKRFIKIF